MNRVQMAAKLYEARDAAKMLLGAHYKRDMELWAVAIRGEAESKKTSELAAAISMAKQADGFGAVMILAAAVEMTEPSVAA